MEIRARKAFIEGAQLRNRKIESEDNPSEICGLVDGRNNHETCCLKHGRYITVQLQDETEGPVALEIADIAVFIHSPVCTEQQSSQEKDLCSNNIENNDMIPQLMYNDDRNDGNCEPEKIAAAMAAEKAEKSQGQSKGSGDGKSGNANDNNNG